MNPTVKRCPNCDAVVVQHARGGALWNPTPEKGYLHAQSCPARKTRPAEEKK